MSQTPAPKTDQALADEQAQIRLLRDQVDALQIAATEKKRPWFKDLSMVLSMLALGLSVLSTVRTVYRESAGDVKAKREEIRGMLVTLIQQKESDDSAASSRIQTPSREYGVLLDAIEAVEKEVPDSLSYSEYAEIGALESTYGDPLRGVIYYEKAIEEARDDVERFRAHQSIGAVFFTASAYRDVKRGESEHDIATNIACAHTAPNYGYLCAIGFAYWATGEFASGQGATGAEYAARALDKASGITDPDWRDETLHVLEEEASRWGTFSPRASARLNAMRDGGTDEGPESDGGAPSDFTDAAALSSKTTTALDAGSKKGPSRRREKDSR